MGQDMRDWIAAAQEHQRKVELEQLRIENARLKQQNDPQWDGTDAAHPAWWRGQEQAGREWSKRLEAMRAELEQLKSASLANSIKLAELERMRVLLASGQCVDLAQLEGVELGERSDDICRTERYLTSCDTKIKAWLIEKAGVKL